MDRRLLHAVIRQVCSTCFRLHRRRRGGLHSWLCFICWWWRKWQRRHSCSGRSVLCCYCGLAEMPSLQTCIGNIDEKHGTAVDVQATYMAICICSLLVTGSVSHVQSGFRSLLCMGECMIAWRTSVSLPNHIPGIQSHDALHVLGKSSGQLPGDVSWLVPVMRKTSCKPLT
jgi:hypothetical protein